MRGRKEVRKVQEMMIMMSLGSSLTLHVFSGDQSQGAASPAPLKKDVENMEKGKVESGWS